MTDAGYAGLKPGSAGVDRGNPRKVRKGGRQTSSLLFFAFCLPVVFAFRLLRRLFWRSHRPISAKA
ncbi:MAG: hypothetical protein WAM75_13895 [Xanthobacteraceae bacterium]